MTMKQELPWSIRTKEFDGIRKNIAISKIVFISGILKGVIVQIVLINIAGT